MNITNELIEKINIELDEILGDDKNIYNIHPDYDIPVYSPNKQLKKILVFSGGGIKGISYIGVLKALEDLNYLNNFEIFAGTSIGSLMLGLYVIGYTPDELYEFIINFDLAKMKSINIFNMLHFYGLDKGNKVEYVIKRLISAKELDPDITLSELYDLTKKEIIITSVCLNSRSIEYLSYRNYPNLQLSKAIRMSISIPWFYTPVLYNNKLYVDGGCIDNYPIAYFKENIDDVLGIYLVDSKDSVENINNLEMCTMRIIQCFMDGVNINSKKGYEQYTINIQFEYINIVDYEIDVNKKKEIYQKGYDTIMDKFK